MAIDITEMNSGKSGIVKEITGGHGLSKKLQSLGIRPGKKITKISSHIGRGPQIISVDNSRIAIGYGIAKKIIIEIEN